MNRVRVRFLAVPSGTLEQNPLEIDVPPSTTVEQLLRLLAEQQPILRVYTRFVSAAVNRVYVGLQTELVDGDEVVFAPPVGGG